jgi:CHAT domain-containing protein
VFTAKYEGVARWPALPSAEQEAAELAQEYPPSHIVQPLYDAVMRCLRGEPPADVMHFAMHGQFDPEGVDEGLVLLKPKQGGGFTAQYLQPPHVDSVEFGQAPFVFLNACQVGASKDVLGDYAGMAAAFLRAGAAGVVAPLWNVDDRIASALAHEFYEAAYSADPPSVAEVLRRVRARYTRDAAIAGATDSEGHPTIGPTLIAYQLFGHPRLRLVRPPSANGDHHG